MKTGLHARTYDELRTEISARHSGVSRRLQQIAEYASENPNDMALETVAVIAERADVHPSNPSPLAGEGGTRREALGG